MDAPIWWMAAGLIAIAICVIGVILWQDLREPREELPGAAVPAAARQSPGSRRPGRAVMPPRPLLDHSAYEHAPSVSRAHAITQTHIDCSARECARKRQALGVLAGAGKITLATRPRVRLAGAPADVIPVAKKAWSARG